MKKGIFLLLMFIGLQMTVHGFVRLKDIASVAGVRDNQLIGYGLVVGLDGTGDKSSTFTSQSMTSMLGRLGVNLDQADVQSKNVAAVIVTANLAPYSQPGQRIDVSLSSLGDAESLAGGVLLMTPLEGPDGEVYAVAQGAISIGGFNAGSGGAGGASVHKNHTLVGRIAGGAIVEKAVPTYITDGNSLTLVLRDPDFTSVSRIKDSINEIFENSAIAIDRSQIKIKIPREFVRENRIVDFISMLEKLDVRPDSPARIVVNERTGTIVAGSGVRISTVAVAHGNLSITIKAKPVISQPSPFSLGETVVESDVDVETEEQDAKFMVLEEGVTIGEVAEALNALGVTPRDMISIFQAMKEAQALHAELLMM